MPIRATKRGSARTPLQRDCDVLICGASFGGLAVARELAGGHRGPKGRGQSARVLMIDRYEVGERQTSACGIPTDWLVNLGLEEAVRQTFSELVIHSPHATARYALPWTFSTFDYRVCCRLLRGQGDAEFETAKVEGITRDPLGPHVVHTDRGDITSPLVVDALGWRRVLGARDPIQPPDALLSRGLEVHPSGSGEDLEVWIDRSYCPIGYGWSFPARDELRIGIGSFDPRFHVKDSTVQLAEDVAAPGGDRHDYQGNWIPHDIRPAAQDEVFYVGDSAGHCIPLSAEGIRTALYFGIACGRELRDVLDGERTRDEALRSYASFSARHAWKFRAMLGLQRLVPRLPPRVLGPALRAMSSQRFVDWAFVHYLRMAHPDFALESAPRASVRRRAS